MCVINANWRECGELMVNAIWGGMLDHDLMEEKVRVEGNAASGHSI